MKTFDFYAAAQPLPEAQPTVRIDAVATAASATKRGFVGPPLPPAAPFPKARALFIGHLTGTARETGCCCGPESRWCEEGQELRRQYLEALRGVALRFPAKKA